MTEILEPNDLPTDTDGEPCRWLNKYRCDDCGTSWEDSWSCCCDDECPQCGHDVSAEESEDLLAPYYAANPDVPDPDEVVHEPATPARDAPTESASSLERPRRSATKHPAGPFTVRVSAYSIQPGEVGAWGGNVYSSRHRSPHGAARRLATIVSGKSALAKEVSRVIPPGPAGRFQIEGGDGTRRALAEHRAAFPN